MIPNTKVKHDNYSAPNRGRLTISGSMRSDGPSVRVIFNKDSVITDKNIKGLQAVYKESVKPKRTTVKADEPAKGKSIHGNQTHKKKKGN